MAPGCDDSRKLIALVSEMTPGSPWTFRYPSSHPAFVVELGQAAEGGAGPDADIVAFHTACPHMGCPLGLKNTEALTEGRLGPCSCHQSTFDLRFKGRQIYGRATQNLVRVLLEVVGDQVYATGIEGVPFGSALRPTT